MPEPRLVEPDACRWCNVPQRDHVSLWKEPVGWHQWAEPSDEQRLERMKARRAARLAKPTSAPVPETCIATLVASTGISATGMQNAASDLSAATLGSISLAELDRIRAGILALGESKEN